MEVRLLVQPTGLEYVGIIQEEQALGVAVLVVGLGALDGYFPHAH